jgi:hypothetical protein
MAARRAINGAIAGGVAAAVWAAQQPLDKRAFGYGYDDVELLGKAVTTGPQWPVVGTALHIQNGMAFGAAYASLRPLLPGPPVVSGLAAGLVEHVALWPLGRFVDRYHPARGELTPLGTSLRSFAQATWRHALFGLVMGVVEARLNDRSADEPPPPVPVESNGHGSIEQAVAAAR